MSAKAAGQWSLRPLAAAIMCPVQPQGGRAGGRGTLATGEGPSWPELPQSPSAPGAIVLGRAAAGRGVWHRRWQPDLQALRRTASTSQPPAPSMARAGCQPGFSPSGTEGSATATQLDQEVSVQHSPGGRRGEGPVEGSPCALDTFSDPFPMRGAALPPFTERRHRGRKGVSRCLFSLPPRHHEAFGRDAKAWKIRGTQGMGAVTGPGLPELVRRLRRGVRWPPPSSALRSSSKRAASS